MTALRKLPQLTKHAYVGLRYILGGVFLLCGILKLISPSDAIGMLLAIIPLTKGWAWVAITGLSVCEILLGLMMLLDRFVTLAASIASLFLLCSIVAGTLLISKPIACGCFGDLFESKTDEVFMLRNVGLLLLSVFLFTLGAHKEVPMKDSLG